MNNSPHYPLPHGSFSPPPSFTLSTFLASCALALFFSSDKYRRDNTQNTRLFSVRQPTSPIIIIIIRLASPDLLVSAPILTWQVSLPCLHLPDLHPWRTFLAFAYSVISGVSVTALCVVQICECMADMGRPYLHPSHPWVAALRKYHSRAALRYALALTELIAGTTLVASTEANGQPSRGSR